MILSSPAPQCGQRCRSISKAQASAKTNLYSSHVVAKTRLSSRAQPVRPGRTWTVSVWASHWTPDAATPGTSSSLGSPCGTTSERSFVFGASTPWKRIRCRQGRGTSAACGADIHLVRQLVDEGLVQPMALQSDWRFTGKEIARVRRIRRLQSNFEATVQSMAVMLDLMQENDRLRASLQRAGIPVE